MRSRVQIRKGFTLIEVVAAIAIFLLFATGVYSAIVMVFKIVYQSRLQILETALLSEQLEIARNLAYDDVGVSGGVPAGVLPRTITTVRNGQIFTIVTTVRNIDDPFDGTIGGTPNDAAPADYKLVEMAVICSNNCAQTKPVILSTIVPPKNLEGSTKNGALFVNVFDANGLPVTGANVHIVNNVMSPQLVIDDVTDNQGFLKIIDTPTGTLSYEITVSKNGYSSDYTVSSSILNPNPLKPPANVASEMITDISFAIDRVGMINLHSINPSCALVAGVPYSIHGQKVLGLNPDVYKYSHSFVTDAAGNNFFSSLEWDTYFLSTSGTNYTVVGTIPQLPLRLAPGMSDEVKIIVAPKTANSLLVTARDAGTKLPLSDATIELVQNGYDEMVVTGLGYVRQTDWSGGGGQADFVDADKYFSDDGGLANSSPAGDLVLKKAGNFYIGSGWLESSTFDLGQGVNFNNVLVEPLAQPPPAGVNSVLLQLATSNSSTPNSWNFLGPDGTTSTFYSTTSTIINAAHNGQRYLRYRVYIHTDDTKYTPQLSELAVTYTNNCTAPGQSFFNNLASGTYTIAVNRIGYANSTSTIEVAGNEAITMDLSPL